MWGCLWGTKFLKKCGSCVNHLSEFRHLSRSWGSSYSQWLGGQILWWEWSDPSHPECKSPDGSQQHSDDWTQTPGSWTTTSWVSKVIPDGFHPECHDHLVVWSSLRSCQSFPCTSFSPVHNKTLITGRISPVDGKVKATQVHLHYSLTETSQVISRIVNGANWLSVVQPDPPDEFGPGNNLLQSPSLKENKELSLQPPNIVPAPLTTSRCPGATSQGMECKASAPHCSARLGGCHRSCSARDPELHKTKIMW